MKLAPIVLLLATLVVACSGQPSSTETASASEPAAAASSAASIDPFVGTWRLNVEKSTYSPGPPPKSQTTQIETIDNGLKLVSDVANADGTTVHNEISARFDGLQYPYIGPAAPTTRVYTRIDERTIEWVNRVNNAVTTTTRSVVSADGKTRTLTTTGTDEQGRAVNNMSVWEKT